MAIEEKSVAEISAGVRNVYQKAVSVLEKQSLDYGIELLKSVVQKEPGFMDARTLLREAERKYSGQMGAFARFMASFKQNKYILKGRTLLGKKPQEALALCEEALAVNFFSNGALRFLTDCGRALEAPFIVVEGMEGIVEMDDKNETNIRQLAEAYEQTGQGMKMLRLRQMIAAKHPNSLEAQAALRAAAALASMEQNKNAAEQESAAAENKMYKKTQETDDLLRDDRIIRSEEDIRKLIAYYEGLIAEGDVSIDNRRKLAELYQRVNEYNKAIETYNWITQKLGSLDPNIDKAVEACTIAIWNNEIEAKQAMEAPQEEINAIQQKINQYRLERAEDRVKAYPNDAMIRYEMAVVYWELGMVDNALEQFQAAQRNPAKRLNAIVYLGRCFSEKQQFDMAIEQFDKALKDMPVLDALKMEALYYKGLALDATGMDAESLECYKEIYSVNVNYMDVGTRIDAYYAKKRAEREAAQK